MLTKRQPPGILGGQMTNPTYELVCGMEVHAELKTASKMFCGCKNDPFGAEKPNSHTCPVCLALPGALPVANKKAIEWTIMLGLALGCKINLFSKFDRKHYFYPDLPKGYQISQYDLPFCYDGKLETSFGTVRIHRIHLEEDTGKLLHKKINGEDVSLIDFNRGGVPLIEIVTEADIHSPEQAKEYGKKLREILRFLEISDCDMDQGGMRLEANVSVRPVGTTEMPSYKTELKNINSFKFMEQAINFEMKRQEKLLAAGETVVQETLGWNVSTQQTFSQRSKEEAEDYRYFPDPDLPPIRFTQAQIDVIKKSLPELPTQIVERWENEYQIEPRFGTKLFNTASEANIFESLFSSAKNKKVALDKLASALVNKQVSLPAVESDVEKIINEFAKLNSVEDVDTGELKATIQTILSENPDVKEKYAKGEKQVIGFLMGQVMRVSGKKLDPAAVRATILLSLEK
ncbi:MAG: Asp-tRNA(Asn)/Glu-tRNA(Gln) amidotransferase GatCAB subunit B [Candidatus Pacebacteria bacterium CG_4_10_14_0_8_um_filter_42_14]|nr:MAG: Asp-tRNA(Asn)/Glu-tRNA(Gln) amidotransferase GatCAB subunit B [Candidatus Pacebacteria bacterium CG_4_10_14_0_8_um_filter_42_14]